MKYIVFGLFVLVSTVLDAQVLRSNDENAVKQWYIFADQCNLREKPNGDAKVLAKLFIGTEVKFIEGTLIEKEQNGVRKKWVKISANGITGYVWGGNLAEHAIKLPSGEMALLSITKDIPYNDTIDMGSKVWASLRIASGQKIVSIREFEVVRATNPREGYMLVLPDPELDNVRHVIVYCTYADACGVYSSEHIFFDKGDELYYLGSGYGMGDGGMLHESKTYEISFSKELDDHVVSSRYVGRNRIRRSTEEGELGEDCVYTTIRKVLDFTWDGVKVTKECME